MSDLTPSPCTLSYSALDMQQDKVMRKSLQLESHLYILVATHIIAEAQIDGLGNKDSKQMVSDGQHSQ